MDKIDKKASFNCALQQKIIGGLFKAFQKVDISGDLNYNKNENSLSCTAYYVRRAVYEVFSYTFLFYAGNYPFF